MTKTLAIGLGVGIGLMVLLLLIIIIAVTTSANRRQQRRSAYTIQLQNIVIQGRLYVEATNLGFAPPQMWPETLFDELKAYRYKKERSVAFKIRQNAFRPGLCPDPAWGAHDAPSDPLVGWGGDTCPHTSPHSARWRLDSPSALRFDGGIAQIIVV